MLNSNIIKRSLFASKNVVLKLFLKFLILKSVFRMPRRKPSGPTAAAASVVHPLPPAAQSDAWVCQDWAESKEAKTIHHSQEYFG